jgi:hypothetical protein|tara:strand:- start:1921 stop:2130 length:210 start_codon:yes stop_codon:yes gene_type:complete
MANVTVISFTTGGQSREMEGSRPIDLAKDMDMTLNGVSIFVNDEPSTQGQTLHNGDIVSFQQEKVSSGK